MQVISPDLSTSDIQRIFKAIDLDNDSQISFTEFLAATIDPREIDMPALNKAFSLLDREGKGYITTKDLHKILAVTHEEQVGINNIINSSFSSKAETDDDEALAHDSKKETTAKRQKPLNAAVASPASLGVFGKENSFTRQLKRALSTVSTSFQQTNVPDDTSEGALLNLKCRISEIIQCCDVDNDGVISYEEFLWAMGGGDKLLPTDDPRVRSLSIVSGRVPLLSV